MTKKSNLLITPYGGSLVSLAVTGDEREELIKQAGSYPTIRMTPRQTHDMELLAVGGFSPLDRFMGQEDYKSVMENMTLADGTIWPIPIILTIDKVDLPDQANWVTLRDVHNQIMAVMRLEEVFRFNWREEAEKVYGTVDVKHPIVSEMAGWGDLCLSGELKVLNLPVYDDFAELRLTPTQTRAKLEEIGNSNVVAFQTRNPMHRVHEELTKRASKQIDGSLLIHPVVGMTKPGDVNHYTRVRIYKALFDNYYDKGTLLGLLPLAMRMGGPREAVWHAIIRRNYGANHFIVGRDHAGPGNDSTGKPFYGPYDAQELLKSVEKEIGVKMVPFEMMVYLPDEDRYELISQVPEGTATASISGTQVREDYLAKDLPLPEWFTRKETSQILLEAYPPRHKQGFCIWFTGLSGSGKSTIAKHLISMLQEYGRNPTVLDGDVVRTHLSKGLGFSKEDRDTNILRISFVAGEIVRHTGAVICAAISPFRQARREARKMVPDEHFIEVFVDTPLEVCEQRDVKGLYARARAGELKNFTGIDDPYEEPIEPEIHIKTVGKTPTENAREIIDYLLKTGFLVEYNNNHQNTK
ncbi:MAG: bifunctional sulfate adenylyltransferase/adenylylsulfate kinase [Brevefilum sp.]|jgi:sulfate adenylyltransferase